MEPLDPEMQRWLAEEAAIARQERAELYYRVKAAADAEDLSRARGVLASIPPPLAGQVRSFVKIHEAPALPSPPDGEIQLIEGTVFDIYSVMTGSMSGDDDFLAFKVISHGDRMTSWRQGSIDLALGNVVRIKFVLIKSIISRGNDGDHIDDPILEVWIEAKDQMEAVKWYRKAAEQNYGTAQFNLSVCYNNGEGVAKDFVEAYKWRMLAAKQGDEDAKKTMTNLEKKMTPEQIAEGRKLACDFKPLTLQ